MKLEKTAFYPVIRGTLLYLLRVGIVIVVVPALYFMGAYGGNFILVICALGFLCIPVFYIFRPKQFRKTKRSKLALVIAVLVVALLFYFNQPQGRVMRKIVDRSEVRIESITFSTAGNKVTTTDQQLIKEIEDKLNAHDFGTWHSGPKWDYGLADVQLTNPDFLYNAEVWVNENEKIIQVGFYINKKDDEIPLVVEVSYANTTDSELLSLYAEE